MWHCLNVCFFGYLYWITFVFLLEAVFVINLSFFTVSFYTILRWNNCSIFLWYGQTIIPAGRMSHIWTLCSWVQAVFSVTKIFCPIPFVVHSWFELLSRRSRQLLAENRVSNGTESQNTGCVNCPLVYYWNTVESKRKN